MENRINKVLTLANGEKYIIFKQAVYKGDNYFVANQLTDDKKDLTDNFAVLHEFMQDGDLFIEKVNDPALMSLILKHLGLR